MFQVPPLPLRALVTLATLGAAASLQAATYNYAVPVPLCGASASDPGCTTDFRGTGDLYLFRSTTSGTGIEIDHTFTKDFSSASPFNNPRQVAGLDRPVWRMEYNENGSGTDTGLMTWDVYFNGPGGLRRKDYMVFVDFDFEETVSIKAFDLNDNLLGFNDLLFEVWNGQEDSPPADWSEWFAFDAPAGYSGRLQSLQGTSGSNDTVVTVKSKTAIGRLQYDFSMNPSDRNDIERIAYFNFAASVPEPGTLGLMLVGAAGAAAAARRRRA